MSPPQSRKIQVLSPQNRAGLEPLQMWPVVRPPRAVIAMENGPFIDGLPGFTWVYLSKMVIFHSYVKLSEGNYQITIK